jgi:periplasmic divalent cation tolerance protein
MDTASPKAEKRSTTIEANLDAYIVVQVTTASREEANHIAHAVVDGGLAGSVQIAAVRTRYRWQGSVQETDEQVITIFTRRERFPAVAACVHEYHTYDVPQIVALPIVASTAPFLRWIDETSVASTDETP